MSTSADSESTNSLGIPKAIFLEDVDKFMKEDSKTAEDVIRKLDELYQKYRFMEMGLIQKKDKLKTQIPDIRMSLDQVLLIKSNNEQSKTMEVDFILSHNLYAKAEVAPTDKVCLWLGANVMLEYTNKEAEELLSKNLTQATLTMAQVEKDLDFLK
jgi:prefoldin subunit 5